MQTTIVNTSRSHPVAAFYAGFTREHAFLLELLGSLGSVAPPADLDWQRLFTIADPRLFPFLGHRLEQCGIQQRCPSHCWARVQTARLVTAARWLRIRQELASLTAELARHNIPVIALKGAVLAQLAYPDPGLRPMSDVDLLVRASDLPIALRVVEAAGFVCPPRHLVHHPLTFEGLHPLEERAIPMQKPGLATLLEIHTQLDTAEPLCTASLASIWQRSDLCRLDDCRIGVLECNDFLLQLAMHASRHHVFNAGLMPFLDMHLWVCTQDLDWDEIADRCLAGGYAGWIYLTMRLTRDLLGTPVPEAFLTRLPVPPECDTLQRLAYEQIWQDARQSIPLGLSMALAEGSWLKTALRGLRRLHPAEPPRDRIVNFPHAAAPTTAQQRLLVDIRLRIAAYLRAWRRGALSLQNIRRNAELIRQRREIQRLLG